MVGESYSNADVYQKRETGETILELDGFSGPGFYNVSLSVNKGQIIGLTGLQGPGSSELMQCTCHKRNDKASWKGCKNPFHSQSNEIKSRNACIQQKRKFRNSKYESS